MKTIHDLEEKCEDHIGSIYHCVKILTSEDVGSGGTNVRSSDAYFFFYILTIQDVRSGRTPRAKEHMKKPDLDDTES